MVEILWAFSFLSEDRDDGNATTLDNTNSTDASTPIEGIHIDGVIQTGIVKQVVRIIKDAAQLGEEAWNQIAQLRAAAARDGKNLEDSNIPIEVTRRLSISDCLIAPCVRIMGNIVCGSNQQTAEVVNAGFFDVIEICIDHRTKSIKKESCWALSNVVAGTIDQLEEFFKKKRLLKKVVQLCHHGDINVRKEAGWCLSNAIPSATLRQIDILVDAGFIQAMVNLLNCEIEKVVLMAIEALHCCLVSYNKQRRRPDHESNLLVTKMEELGGLDSLERVQASEKLSDFCSQKAADFVVGFWPDINDGEEEEKENHLEDNADNDQVYDPEPENNQTNFGFGQNDTSIGNKSTNQPFNF